MMGSSCTTCLLLLVASVDFDAVMCLRVILQPQDSYGLEKLASEELCMHYNRDFGIECRVARFHNIYGPHGTWKGGREKAPAAFCRKVRLCLKVEDVSM
jgi:nucleoside-diphosphate-sugar epimerase